MIVPGVRLRLRSWDPHALPHQGEALQVSRLWPRLHYKGTQYPALRLFNVTIKAIEFSLFSKGNLKQHQAIHNNSPKGDNKPDEETGGDTQDNQHPARNENLLNMAKENGLKRSSPDTEDSLPSSKRPPGKYINPSKAP